MAPWTAKVLSNKILGLGPSQLALAKPRATGMRLAPGTSPSCSSRRLRGTETFCPLLAPRRAPSAHRAIHNREAARGGAECRRTFFVLCGRSPFALASNSGHRHALGAEIGLIIGDLGSDHRGCAARVESTRAASSEFVTGKNKESAMTSTPEYSSRYCTAGQGRGVHIRPAYHLTRAGTYVLGATLHNRMLLAITM